MNIGLPHGLGCYNVTILVISCNHVYSHMVAFVCLYGFIWFYNICAKNCSLESLSLNKIIPACSITKNTIIQFQLPQKSGCNFWPSSAFRRDLLIMSAHESKSHDNKCLAN